MATTPKRSTRATYRHLPRLLNLLWTLAALALLSACLESKQDHPVLALETLGASGNIAEALAEHGIAFTRRDTEDTGNFVTGLAGETYQAKDILASHYTMDWENSTAHPNVTFLGVPLMAPLFLTDQRDTLYIVTTDIGNVQSKGGFDGIKGEAAMGVFDDDQIMTLKSKLIEQHGEPTANKEDYRGQVYFWRLNDGAIRLAIKNECLCQQANSWSGDVRPEAGRGGALTLYYSASLPEFKDESEDF